MTIVVREKKWSVVDLDATLKSPAPYLLGCERCASTCAQVAQCKCCSSYGLRTRGGLPGRYPEDGNRHVPLVPMIRFREKIAMAQAVKVA